jgi:regulator of sigma E protease
MNSTTLLGGLIFIVAFLGLIVAHEFGHFIVSRLFKVEVKEFGIGLPPRMFRYWRAKGRMLIGNQELRIPANFDLPAEDVDFINRSVLATADRVNDALFLRTIEFADEPAAPATAREAIPAEAAGKPYLIHVEEPAPAPVVRGAEEIKGVVKHIEEGTEYTVNWLPVGGFVLPKGENDPAVAGGLAAAKPGVRLAVMLAGPLVNLILGVLVYSLIFVQTGIPDPKHVTLYEVLADSPAAQAGMQVNDVVISVNGQPVANDEQFRALIKENVDKPMALVLQRGDQTIETTAIPSSKRTAEQGRLGVKSGQSVIPAKNWFSTLGYSTYATGYHAYRLLTLPADLIRGAIPAEEGRFIGFRGIFDIFQQSVSRDVESREPVAATPVEPTYYTLSLIASLTITLGVFNLLPFPALDGGRIIFLLPELIFRRRVPQKIENTVHAVGMAILLLFMLYVNVMDFINPINFNLP